MTFVKRASNRSSETTDPAGPIARAETEAKKARLTAELILKDFDDYYIESRRRPRALKKYISFKISIYF